MSLFEFAHHAQDLPDRAFVEVDGRYSVVIVRTEEGLRIDVWPQGWDATVGMLTVYDRDVDALPWQEGALP